MTIKLQERGRGKFKPAPDYSLEDVKEILYKKIQEETNQIINQPDSYNSDDLIYKTNKANIISLFSGAGGLDLGVELAGLDCIVSKDKVDKSLNNKNSFKSIRHQGIFHHVYSNDIFREALETYNTNFPNTV